MKLGQIQGPDGNLVAAISEGDYFHPIPGYTLASLIEETENSTRTLSELAEELASSDAQLAKASIPVNPSEVWACGCTYAPSAEFRDAEHGTREGFYSYVHNAKNRPEIFFKGTDRVCVGSGEPIGIRSDSSFTAPEPELGVVIDSKGKILGYTLGDDVSAWDIERENPLYLPQSKVYQSCCSLGPVLVTVDEIEDPYSLEMSCTIVRGEQTIFSGSVSTDKLRRKIEELVDCLLQSNPVPTATVILTGTGIIVTQESALIPGDVVTIEVPEIGKLVNPTVLV